MKRLLIGFICICMLLCGCKAGSNSNPPEQTDSSTQSPSTQVKPLGQPLLEQGTREEESSNLLYIPNKIVEGLNYSEMDLFENGLLFSQYTDGQLILNHISLEDGALLTSGSVPASPGVKVYIGNGEIGVCDMESGLITIIDKKFQTLRTYSVGKEGEEWYLNGELDTLYIRFYDKGLVSKNLETGKEIWMIENGFRVVARGGGSSYLLIEYTDRADQKTYTRYVNLSTASMSTLPMGGNLDTGFCQGDTWLLDSTDTDEEYTIVEEDSVFSFVWKDSPVSLLSPNRHLLVMDSSQRNLTLYDIDGTFVSHCKLPENSAAFIGEDFVWSGYWEGYFFVDYIDATPHLMFWNVKEDTEGENLTMTPSQSAQQTKPVLEAQLYEKAKNLSQRFGVDIRIGEQCALNYNTYKSEALTDALSIRIALDVLEYCFSQYPEGFLKQLPYGSIETIRVELVGEITIREGIENHPDSAGGFAQPKGSYYLVVLDANSLGNKTVFHEFSHIIDKKLDWDSQIRGDALYSEESWQALLPEGFSYAWDYINVPEEFEKYIYSGDFIRKYSMTFPTEDRADLMAEAMQNHRWEFSKGTSQRKRFEFYAKCIRDCFDTDGWPDETVWEQIFQ